MKASVHEITRFIDEAYNDLLGGSNSTWHMQLNDCLELDVGWSGGFDERDTINGDGYAICGKICVNDDLPDYDWATMPYYEDGDVYDTETELWVSGNGYKSNINEFAEYVYQCVDDIMNLWKSGEVIIPGCDNYDSDYHDIEWLIDNNKEDALTQLRINYLYEVNDETVFSADENDVSNEELISFYGSTEFVPGDFGEDSWVELESVSRKSGKSIVKESKKRLYKATVEYKLFDDKDYDDFSDTYEIDEDYFYDEDDIYNYIAKDMLLVVGGGYSTKNIEKATVKINGKVVREIDKSNQKQKLPTSANENVSEPKSRKSVNELYDYYLDRDTDKNYRKRNARNGYSEVKPTRQKSFYGKAVMIDLPNGGVALKSYDTLVCGYEIDEETGALEFKKYWDDYSATTMNHINAFRDYMKDDALNKAQWTKMLVSKTPRVYF